MLALNRKQRGGAAVPSPSPRATKSRARPPGIAHLGEVQFVDERDGRIPAALYMSEAAMLMAGLASGQLVAVSLESESESSYCDELGARYAVAVCWPSKKLERDALRVSKSLSNSLGRVAVGASVWIHPLSQECAAGADGRLATRSLAKAGAKAAVGASVQTCTRLQLAFRGPLLPDRPAASALASIAEGDEQVTALLQMFALRWLADRFLLPGSLVVLPVCGVECVFWVSDLQHGALKVGVDGVKERKLEGNSGVGDGDGVRVGLPAHVDVFHVVRETVVEFLRPVGGGASVEGEVVEARVEEEVGRSEVAELRFSALGGLSDQIQALRDVVELPVLQPMLYTRYGLLPPRGVLLYGPSGTGKTSLARAAAAEAGLPLFVVNGPELVQEFYGGSENALEAVFASAVDAAPSVVFIDELDAIAPQRKNGIEELAHRMVSALLTLLDGGVKQDLEHWVTVIGATNRLDAVDSALRRPGRFDREIEVGIPTPSGRREILDTVLSHMKHSLSQDDVQTLAAATHGFVGADLTALCNEAAMTALRSYVKHQESTESELGIVEEQLAALSVSKSSSEVSSPPQVRDRGDDQGTGRQPRDCRVLQGARQSGRTDLRISPRDFALAKTKVRPSGMREVMLEVPVVRWCDIGGQEEVKQQLREIVEWPQKHGDALARIGAQAPRGVMLYGPPGCSKTLMARAVAAEAELSFLAVKGPELLSKWVGESEKAVCTLFARARAAAPSIIFFDEVDGLVGDRDNDQDGECSVGSRVISQILVELDGLKPSTGVAVVAATNRPDKIDPALLRPGRFDRLLFVGPPDTPAREEIFKIHLRSVPCSPAVSVQKLASLTSNYTGADISAVCREAALAALEEDVTVEKVCMRHFESALEVVQPSAAQYVNMLFHSSKMP